MHWDTIPNFTDFFYECSPYKAVSISIGDGSKKENMDSEKIGKNTNEVYKDADKEMESQSARLT